MFHIHVKCGFAVFLKPDCSWGLCLISYALPPLPPQGVVILVLLRKHTSYFIQTKVLSGGGSYCNSEIWLDEDACYRAVTIQRPRVTLAAKRTLPPSKMKNPIRSLTSLSPITEVRVASRKEFKIHWPSKAKQGTALTIARAPEREIRYLTKVSNTTGRSMLRKLKRGMKLVMLTV